MKFFTYASTVALLAGLAATASAAVDDNTAQIRVIPSVAGGTGPNEQLVTQTGPIDLVGSATANFNTTGSAEAHVAYGVLKLHSTGFGSAVVISRGVYRDAITITSPGISTGTPGSLSFSISVNGTLVADAGDSTANYFLSATVNGGAPVLARSGAQYSPYAGGGYFGEPFGTSTGTISFQYGLPLLLEVELTATSSVSFPDNNNPGSATVNMLNSSYWGGITNVQANGSPVSSFSTASVSGTNWAASLIPVPEPSTLGMLGLSLLPLLKRRRTARQ